MKTVIEMAREAGWDDHHAEFDTRLKQFAELVRADERERIAQHFSDQNLGGVHTEWVAAAIRRGNT